MPYVINGAGKNRAIVSLINISKIVNEGEGVWSPPY